MAGATDMIVYVLYENDFEESRIISVHATWELAWIAAGKPECMVDNDTGERILHPTPKHHYDIYEFEVQTQ